MNETKLTLSMAFERHYQSDELRRSTVVWFQSALKLWERLTESPDVREIDNVMVDRFRTEAMKEFAPYTVNRYWGACRSILRRIGPQETRNPWGIGIIPRIPAMRPCKVEFHRPRRLSMEELDRIYLAARRMKVPCRHVPHPGFWWQAFVVLAYCTGLRLGDLLKAKWSDLNEEEATLFVRTGKTGIEADLPLTDIVMGHLVRLERQKDRIFHIEQRRFTKYQSIIREYSQVEWTTHDIRRTACSEADRVKPGMGKVLTLHAPCNVTERSYLNAIPELREVVEKMEFPTAFRHGPKMTLRAMREAKKVVTLRPGDFTVPVHPPMEAFEFFDHGLSFCGRYIQVRRRACLRVLAALVEKGGTCTQPQLWAATEEKAFPTNCGHLARKGLSRNISRCRQFLCEIFALPKGFNPIVPTVLDRPWEGCSYELFLPPALWQEHQKEGAA